jgi:uncharacterized DUF497 family protein
VAGSEETGFEWDEDKRLSNIAKHDIDFVRAQDLFDGRPLTHLPSTYEAEPRRLTIGVLEGRVVTAVWTHRTEAIRFISVRRARKSEVAVYRLEHGEWDGDDPV